MTEFKRYRYPYWKKTQPFKENTPMAYAARYYCSATIYYRPYQHRNLEFAIENMHFIGEGRSAESLTRPESDSFRYSEHILLFQVGAKLAVRLLRGREIV